MGILFLLEVPCLYRERNLNMQISYWQWCHLADSLNVSFYFSKSCTIFSVRNGNGSHHLSSNFYCFADIQVFSKCYNRCKTLQMVKEYIYRYDLCLPVSYSARNWCHRKMVSLLFYCVICVDRSWYLVCICSNILINIVGRVQCQHNHLSNSESIPMLKLISTLSLTFDIIWYALCMYWLRFFSLVCNSLLGSREMKTNDHAAVKIDIN